MFTVIVPNAKTETPVPLIKAQVRPDSVVYTDTFGAYDALDVSDFRHHRINHSRLFAEQVNHIKGENVWSQANRQLRRSIRIKPEYLHWFLSTTDSIANSAYGHAG